MGNLTATLAWILAAVVLGFSPHPLVGKNALFVTSTALNLAHPATAIGFVVVALIGEKASLRFMQAFGAVYMLTGLTTSCMSAWASPGSCTAGLPWRPLSFF